MIICQMVFSEDYNNTYSLLDKSYMILMSLYNIFQYFHYK